MYVKKSKRESQKITANRKKKNSEGDTKESAISMFC